MTTEPRHSSPSCDPTAGEGLGVEATLLRGTFRAEIALTVPRGGALALLGPNGAGKSTVLRAVAGLDPLADGHVRIDGRPVEDTGRRINVPVRDRRIGYVFQDYRLFPHLDVLGNVAFGLRASGSSKSEARRRAAAVLARAGLERFSRTDVSELSGGEAQQVAVARALATNPALLLLDEPLAALDIENRAAMREQLAGMIRSFGVTVLLVTHDPGDALAIPADIAVIENGRIVQRGTGRELAIAPASRYVALLVDRTGISGEIKPGTVTRAAGELELDTTAGPVTGRLADTLAGAEAGIGPAFASFNPAAVRVSDGPPAGAVSNRFQATVTLIEQRLGHTVCELQLDPKEGGEGPVIQAKVAADRGQRLARGDRITMEIPPDAVRIAPRETPGRNPALPLKTAPDPAPAGESDVR